MIEIRLKSFYLAIFVFFILFFSFTVSADHYVASYIYNNDYIRFSSLSNYNGQLLYIGGYKSIDPPIPFLGKLDAGSISSVTLPPVSPLNIPKIWDLDNYNGKMYIDKSFRYGGSSFEDVTGSDFIWDGFSEPNPLVEFNGKLYSNVANGLNGLFEYDDDSSSWSGFLNYNDFCSSGGCGSGYLWIVKPSPVGVYNNKLYVPLIVSRNVGGNTVSDSIFLVYDGSLWTYIDGIYDELVMAENKRKGQKSEWQRFK